MLILPKRSKFLKVTEVARLTATAIPPGDEVSPEFARLQTVHAHIACVDRAVSAGSLRLFDPVSFTVVSAKYARQTVGGGDQCVVSWDDFVAFAVSLGIDVKVSVTEGSSSTPQRANSRQAQQEDQLLLAISELGYIPDKLPKRIPGKSWVKNSVRSSMTSLSKNVFDKAWDRLRTDGRISESED